MRELKFRAWYDGKLYPRVGVDLSTCDLYDPDWDPNWMVNPPHVGTIGLECEGLTVEQFTGLKDSDGVEIYEGDWVEFTYWWFDGHGEAESTLSGEVVYLPECLSFGLKGVKTKAWLAHVGATEGSSDTAAFAFWRFAEDDFHVRGNVHQNTELLT